MKVLVIEDDDDFRSKEVEALIRHGYDVIQASSEKEAVNLLHIQNKEFGIALVDLFMEAEMSGLNIIQLIRDQYPWIVTVVVTGYDEVAKAANCMEAGAFSFVRKNHIGSEDGDLLDVIERAKKRHRTELGIVQLRDQFESLGNALELLGRLEDEDHQRRPRNPSV